MEVVFYPNGYPPEEIMPRLLEAWGFPRKFAECLAHLGGDGSDGRDVAPSILKRNNVFRFWGEVKCPVIMPKSI